MHVNASDRVKTQESNCAFCSAAGAVNLTFGSSRYSSKDVADLVGSGQSAMASTGGGGQAAKIISFVEAKTKPSRKAVRILDSETKLPQAIQKMKEFPPNTVFAIHISGQTVVGDKCSHWLNALLTKGSSDKVLRYFDFQTNRVLSKEWKGPLYGDPTMVGGANPSSSMNPFVGIVAQDEMLATKANALQHGQTPDGTAHRGLHVAQQSGTFLPNASTADDVIAFPPSG